MPGGTTQSHACRHKLPLLRYAAILEILAFWDDGAKTWDNLHRADDFLVATLPFSSGEVYVNSLKAETHRGA